ncbi:uncharacterized protein YbbK (DUF523 family) [Neisseria sp. HSC-16F19]|nr:DUF523 domain-containing protein [Neisseria sp. HSC-16F19]MCP2039649.1 uncharacterized protein YbbK (DUF523 family) [Neisseria sp. HSC-16F19]
MYPSEEEVVLVSACLLGQPVRYNGHASADPALVAALADKRVIPVCPEILAGLPTPRLPAELCGGDGNAVLDGTAQVVDLSGQDVSAAYLAGAEATLALAQQHGARRAVLKENSPSCGCSRVYDGRFCNAKAAGQGVTAALLRRHGIEVEGRG